MKNTCKYVIYLMPVTSVNQNIKDCFIFVFVETSFNCYLE